MRRRNVLSAPLLLLARTARAAGPLNVVATFSILADLTRQIGGDKVAITTLVAPGADAHTFQPRPSDLIALRNAAVLVENGFGLEGWMNRMVRSAGFKGRTISASAGIKPRTFSEDGRRVTDPHVWQDPKLAARMVATIAAGLSAADPANAQSYAARADAYINEIDAEDIAIQQAYAAIPAKNRKLITSHDAFGYYAARYGIDVHAPQGISTEAEPSARGLATLAAQIRRDRISTVFLEAMATPRIAESLAREAGAKLGPAVYSDSLSPADGPAPTYLAMLRHNTAAFTASMKP